MKKIKVNPTKLINKRYLPFFNTDMETRIFYGGSSSGKSVFKAQECVLDLLAGRNYLICRKVGRTINTSVRNEILKAISQMKLTEMFNVQKSEMTITAKNNGSQILFGGLDDVEKIKSITPAHGALTDIWVEEATEISYEDYKQLQKRLRGQSRHKKRITLTFNPVYKTHWIYKEFFKDWEESKNILKTDKLLIVKSTYVDNAFLMPDDIDRLLNETDEYYRDVYTYGNWGILGDIIYKNWRVEDLHEVIDLGGRSVKLCDTFDNIYNGLDFGFSSDPAAIIRVHLDKQRKKIYIIDEFLQRGLTNNLLSIEALKIVGDERVTCDSSEPKSIQELKGYGVNARGALKGPDSIVFGIQWLQNYEIIIDIRCQEFKNEITTYQWKKDKDGNSIKQPVDKNNHLLDALRYALEDEMRDRKKGTARMG